MTTMRERLMEGYLRVANDPEATPAEQLAALKAASELEVTTPVVVQDGVLVTPTEAVQGDPPPAERFGHDAPDPTAGVPPVVLGGQVSGPVASDAPVDPQPPTATERAEMRMGRRSKP